MPKSVRIFSLFLVNDARLRSNFKNSCFMFHRGFQTLENNKSISFLVFGNPDETLALVFEILLLSCLLSLRQKESHCKPIPLKMLFNYRFIFMQIRLFFVWKVLYRLLLKTETQANSEVVYLIVEGKSVTFLLHTLVRRDFYVHLCCKSVSLIGLFVHN